LCSTGKKQIINKKEKDSADNRYWGMVAEGKTGLVGKNHLGQILEAIRDSAQQGTHFIHWLHNDISFQQIQASSMLPKIELEHWIGDKLYETITLERKSAFIFGSCSHLANIILDNDSIAD